MKLFHLHWRDINRVCTTLLTPYLYYQLFVPRTTSEGYKKLQNLMKYQLVSLHKLSP